jgi:hypothetical protein
VKRSLLIGLFVILSAMSAEAPDEFGLNLARFHEHYNKFMRAYLGCGKAAVSIDDCKPDLGIFDFREFRHAEEAAAPLFNLQPKRN